MTLAGWEDEAFDNDRLGRQIKEIFAHARLLKAEVRLLALPFNKEIATGVTITLPNGDQFHQDGDLPDIATKALAFCLKHTKNIL